MPTNAACMTHTDAPHAKIRALPCGALLITVGNWRGRAQPHRAQHKIQQLQQYWLKANASYANQPLN